MSLKTFQKAYAECAYWLSTDDNGTPLDSGDYEPAGDMNVTLDTQAAQFYTSQGPLWRDTEGYDDAQAGHDFWLTRNRHGAGFWDRGLGDLGRTLTDIAHGYGACYVYVGDDNRIHVSP
jgi:hypothetical protein